MAPERGFALLEEGRNAFGTFRLLKQGAKGLYFLVKTFRVALGSHGREAKAMRHRNRTPLQDPLKVGDGLIAQCFRGSADPAHQAPLVGGDSIDGITTHQHVKSTSQSYPLDQPLGPPVAGNETKVNFGLSHAGGWRGDTEMAGHGQFQTTTQGKTVDGGQNWFGGLSQAVHDAVTGLGQFAGFGGGIVRKFGDISTGRKGFVP